MENQPKIIGNKSSGYGYKYANLADISRAGVDIPPMRVATLVDGEQNPIIVDGKPIEYIEALRQFADGNGNIREEWIRGARIVIPSMSKSNEAQEYGSALTYARRYTALTVLGIACDDDDKIESHSEDDIQEKVNQAKDELKKLWIAADGPEDKFEDWYNEKTANGKIFNKEFPKMKASLIKKVNDKKEKKDE